MKLPFQSKPKTLADRAEAVRDDALDFVRGIPARLNTSSRRALTIAGGATGAAAGFAFWRSQRDSGPSIHQDPAKPKAAWKVEPPPPVNGASEAEAEVPKGEKPAPDPRPPAKKRATGTKSTAGDAAGTRTK